MSETDTVSPLRQPEESFSCSLYCHMPIIGGLSAMLAGAMTNRAVKPYWSPACPTLFNTLLVTGLLVVGELGWLGLRAFL